MICSFFVFAVFMYALNYYIIIIFLTFFFQSINNVLITDLDPDIRVKVSSLLWMIYSLKIGFLLLLRFIVG